MRTDRQRMGDAAERDVAERLMESGWTILARDLRVGRAEIDILAIDPAPPASLVVVEVRFRRRSDFGTPEETVDRRKAARLRLAGLRVAAAGALPDGRRIPRWPLRVDLVAVEPPRAGALDARLVVRHHRGVL